MDRLVLGKRLRHFRTRAGLTLDQLGERVGVVASQLSLIENGKREPRLSLLQAIAREVGVETAALLSGEAPDRRSALEIELERAQTSPAYAQLALPHVRTPRSLGDDALEALVGLHRELARRSRAAAATPEEARRANTSIRLQMRECDNYLPEIESVAEELMERIGHTTGAVTHREVAVLAELLGFTLIFADDLPSNTRSITDLENGRIYLPPASIPGGHGLRSLALQAMAHRVLGHDRPASYAEFLRQRLEINYFASACLLPETRASEFLQEAKRERNLAIEDLRDAFGVTHEAAAHRFTNLATRHLGLKVHFYRTDASGSLLRGYENDGMPFPVDQTGSVEGQVLCHKWAGRTAFNRTNRTTEFYQYTDCPEGTYWSSVQTGDAEQGPFSIACGVRFDDAKWFRGRETAIRTVSTCPDPQCCRTPSDELLARWEGKAWPSARMHAHVLAPLPTGSFPGVDDTEMYQFLSAHAPQD
ncbi:helix-turn-helix domain-containing protein [Leucobacter sp. CSA1]|uniref:Helix-turn-helix domain-containing protein n=2 Tax=Leucobacter chromiisoli TaxID=2796471 RepID=A0A934Q4Y6_9MICO|nr:helix-turn-helix domain-containing protein [Leucobacter chromiisoli]